MACHPLGGPVLDLLDRFIQIINSQVPEWGNEPSPVYQGVREFQLPFELDIIHD